VKEPGITAKQ
jgi:hypothetical protein